MKLTTRILTQLFRYQLLGVMVLCFGCVGFVRTPINSDSRQLFYVQPQIAHHFEHVLIIVLENQDYVDAIADSYLNLLARKGANFTDFHGLFHPSYSNYLAMVCGKEIPTHFDRQKDLDERTIADLLKSKGLTWRNYAEGYPGGCFKDSEYKQGRYVRKHVPFISFIPIQEHQCENITPASQFDKDLKNSLPNYMFYSPNLDDDGHDPINDPKIGLYKASKWLKGFLDPLLKNPILMKDTLIVVTFDESGRGQYKENHIYTVFLGNMVKTGEYNANYNHFNVLRTIEVNFGLCSLGDGDSSAKPITGMWK